MNDVLDLFEDIQPEDECIDVYLNANEITIAAEVKDKYGGVEKIIINRVKNIEAITSLPGFLDCYKKFKNEINQFNFGNTIYNLRRRTFIKDSIAENIFQIESTLTDEQKLYLECVDV